MTGFWTGQESKSISQVGDGRCGLCLHVTRSATGQEESPAAPHPADQGC
jgi:hypothetical protein